MGNLTDDMTRLRGEVDALRGARGALMNALISGAKDLTRTVSAMRAGFTSNHAAMAKQTRGERLTFVADVIDDVNSLLGGFSRDRNDMARKGRHDRAVFLSDVKRQVTGLCKGTANDLLGARLAWRGESVGKSRSAPIKKKLVAVKPIPPPVKAALKMTVAAAPQTPRAVTLPKVKASRSVGAAMPLPKSKEKSRPAEKPAKAATKGKQGRK